MPTQWLTPDQVLQRIQQTPQQEWHERGAGILQAVVDGWNGDAKEPDVRETPFGKSFFIKATQVGPKFTGPIQDAQGHRVCFREGEHVPCEQFGGSGEGWSNLRSEEDLYDALRRLIDGLKTGSHPGWHELLGLLIHTPVEELQALKQEHRLAAPQDVKEALLQRVQSELQHVGHQIEGMQQQQQQPPVKGLYGMKAEGDTPPAPKQEKPKKPKEQPQQQAAAPSAPPTPPPPETPPPEAPPEEPPEEPTGEVEVTEEADPFGFGGAEQFDLAMEGAELEREMEDWDREHPDLGEEEDRPAKPPRKLTEMDYRFYQSIKDNPDDDTPRLIYADWLEENGETDRAEHLRLEIMFSNFTWQDQSDNPERIKEVEAAINKLESKHPEWSWPWNQEGINDAPYVRFVRGMLHISEYTGDFLRTLREVGEDVALTNVESVRLLGRPHQIANAITWGNNVSPGSASWLSHITSLDLFNTPHLQNYSDAIMTAIRERASRNLVELHLRHTGIGSEDDGSALFLLLNEDGMPNLRVLDLSRNNLSEASLGVLVMYGRAPNSIRQLDLRGSNISEYRRQQLREVYGEAVLMDTDPPDEYYGHYIEE